jgi:hypothetical protein
VGKTALYRDDVPFRPARADIILESDALVIHMPDGRTRRHHLHGAVANTTDGYVADRSARGSSPEIVRIPGGTAHVTPPRVLRRFVRMLVLETESATRVHVITPPDQGAVAPNVVSVPEAPGDAAIVDRRVWDALHDWVAAGGRLAAFSITELARLASIATSQFAALIGEVAAQRALEGVWSASGPLRMGFDLESALQPLVDAAKHWPRANEALVSALAHTAGAGRRRWRLLR